MPFEYQIDMTGLLQAGSGKLKTLLTKNMAIALNDLGVPTRDRVRQPITKHSGGYYFNIKVDRAAPGKPEVKIYVDPGYLAIKPMVPHLREVNTKPHMIFPIN